METQAETLRTEVNLSLCGTCKGKVRADAECDDGWIYTSGVVGYADTATRCRYAAAYLEGRKQAEGLDAAGLSDAQYALEWSEMDLDHKSWKAARALSTNIGEVISEGLNVAFTGPTGRGKTHAAMLLCRDAMRAGHTALRLDWSRFLDGLRDGYNDKTVESEAKKYERLAGVDLLLLDDIGSSGEDGNFSSKRLEKVILRRYDAGKPTLLTANFTAQGLGDLMGERAASRVQQRFMLITFNGVNYRGPERQQGAKTLISRIWAGA